MLTHNIIAQLQKKLR